MRVEFVGNLVESLLRQGAISRDDSVLAICASTSERDLFLRLGFRNVTITNLDRRLRADSFSPYKWSLQDAQNLGFDDDSFDVAFVSDGLHHCSSPHRALLEMYRVCRKTVVAVESRDSLMVRLADKLALTGHYELQAVVENGYSCGGVDNSCVPNYVYRWTEREFEKTISCFNPSAPHRFRYFYDLNLPRPSRPVARLAIDLLRPAERLLAAIFRKQCNSFAMVAFKPGPSEPTWSWLKRVGSNLAYKPEYTA
jgi:SAM-dependent methyltransferase